MNNKKIDFELDFIGNLYRLSFFLATNNQNDKPILMLKNMQKNISQMKNKQNINEFNTLFSNIQNSLTNLKTTRDRQLLAQKCLDGYNLQITRYKRAGFA